MDFLVISDAPILDKKGIYEGYAPYIKEMNIWLDVVDQVTFVCPTSYKKTLLTAPFDRQDINVKSLRRLEFNSILVALISIFTLPYQIIVLWSAMRKADHIHLRAPGNLCLLACMVQVMFPNKKKTAKYAGNWDPLSKQPLAYRLQKKILSNTTFTKNIQVLVYGEWKNSTSNITPFFTASYYLEEIDSYKQRNFDKPLRAIFVGTMGSNKRPFEAVQLINKLRKAGLDIVLEMFGDGPQMEDIKWYRKENGLLDYVILRGNQPANIVKEAYKRSDLVILLSKSEGWPKVIAEGMFWGAIPIVTQVSCVPWMLDNGSRGILVDNPDKINTTQLIKQLEDSASLQKMSNAATHWSRQYTMDTFTAQIKELL